MAGGARHSLSAAEKRGHSSTERRWGVDWRDAKRHFFPPFFFSTQRPLPVSVGVPRSLFSFLSSFFSPHFPSSVIGDSSPLRLSCTLLRTSQEKRAPLPTLFLPLLRSRRRHSSASEGDLKRLSCSSLFLPPLLLGWRCQHHRKVSLFGHPRSLPPPRRDGLDCGGDIFPSSLSPARSRRPTTTQNGF